MGKIQVYCAVSLDGFIAGPEDELDWLGEPASGRRSDPGAVEFSAFMEQIGAILMGRRTFDVVKSHGGDWPYGSVPVLVATTRPLGGDFKTVYPSRGGILELCEQARQAAGRRNVYLDGGKPHLTGPGFGLRR